MQQMLLVILRVECVESIRIRENSDYFPGVAPNSHESGYKETSHSAPREVYILKLRTPDDAAMDNNPGIRTSVVNDSVS